MAKPSLLNAAYMFEHKLDLQSPFRSSWRQSIAIFCGVLILALTCCGCPSTSADKDPGNSSGNGANSGNPNNGNSAANGGTANGGNGASRNSTNSMTSADDPEFRRAFNQAMGMMGQFKYAESYQLFEKLLKQRPQDFDLAVNTAIARLNMAGDEDLNAAKAILDQVLSRDPQHVRANFCVGLLKSYMGPPADPLPHFQICAEKVPEDADVAYLYAKSLEQEQQLDKAKQEFLRCLELNEYYASAMLGLGRIASVERNQSEAKSWIEKFEAMKANPNSRVFEFAYKRMGKLGEVMGGESTSLPKPSITDDMWFYPSAQILAATSLPESFRNDLAQNKLAVNIAVADLDGDGDLDLLINSVGASAGVANLVTLFNDGQQQFSLASELPWNSATQVNAVLVGDIDQDGRNDLYLCRNGNNELFLQTKANSWEKSTDSAVAGGDWETVSGLLVDADHDSDLDIVTANRNGPAQVINNNSNGTFRLLSDDAGIPSSTDQVLQIVAGDFDNQRDLDLWVRRDQKPAQLLLNQKLWNYQDDAALPPELSASDIVSAISLDLTHDGYLDLLVLRSGTLEAWQRSPRGWEKNSQVEITLDHHAQLVGQFAALDLDADGRHEFVFPTLTGFAVTQAGQTTDIDIPLGHELSGWAPAALTPTRGWSLLTLDREGNLWNTAAGPPEGTFVSVEFSGKLNEAEAMRSNRSGIGTRWKARIGERWVSGTSLPQTTLASQSLQPQLIGLNGADSIDFLAVDWSDGVFQAELGLTADQPQRIVETQRQLASCPLIFAWDGERMSFVTDALGVGGIGFMTSPGNYAPPRPWENLLLTESQLRPRDNRYLLKLSEPMEEACYVKSVSLTTIDVPSGWRVIVDERMGITDPQPTGDIHFFRKSFPVVASQGKSASENVAALTATDLRAVDPGPLDLRFIGLVNEPFELAFQFAEPIDLQRGKPALAISGWVEYPYSQTVFAAWQAGKSYEAPSLEVSDDGVNWREVWPQLGYPAGMPRSMMVPLPSSCEGAKWFRLRTNMQIYWDQIELVYLEDCPEAKITTQQPEVANLRYAGFAKRTTGPQFVPQYDYSQRRGTWDCRHLPGFYTRFGDVLPLLTSSSSELAVFGPGEEIHFEFAASQQQPSNYQRWFQLRLEGWCKDMDLYTQDGHQLGPLPRVPSDTAAGSHEKQLYELYNYRYESGPWYNGQISVESK